MWGFQIASGLQMSMSYLYVRTISFFDQGWRRSLGCWWVLFAYTLVLNWSIELLTCYIPFERILACHTLALKVWRRCLFLEADGRYIYKQVLMLHKQYIYIYIYITLGFFKYMFRMPVLLATSFLICYLLNSCFKTVKNLTWTNFTEFMKYFKMWL